MYRRPVMEMRTTMDDRRADRNGAPRTARAVRGAPRVRRARPANARRRRLRTAAPALLLVVALPLAGCIASSDDGQVTFEEYDTWSYSAGGQGTADESGRLDVPTEKVRATMSVGGQASIHLIVTDDDGEVVLQMECTGNGGCSKSRTSDRGQSGDWRIELKGLFSGGVSVTVQATR